MNRERTFEITGTTIAPTFESSSELDRHLAKAQQLRSEATAAALASAFRAISRSARALLAWLLRWRQRRATRDALMRCSDRVLADVGIEREHIPLVAKGLDPAEYQLRDPALGRWWPAVRARLDAARQARRERRRIFRELMAYRDHELDDLGVRRADIPAIARGQPVLGRRSGERSAVIDGSDRPPPGASRRERPTWRRAA